MRRGDSDQAGYQIGGLRHSMKRWVAKNSGRDISRGWARGMFLLVASDSIWKA